MRTGLPKGCRCPKCGSDMWCRPIGSSGWTVPMPKDKEDGTVDVPPGTIVNVVSAPCTMKGCGNIHIATGVRNGLESHNWFEWQEILRHTEAAAIDSLVDYLTSEEEPD